MEAIELIQDQELLKDTVSLHRRILNGYWIVVALSFIAELLALLIKMNNDPSNIKTFIIFTMIIPTSIQLGLVLINEGLDYFYKKPRPYMIILTGILISAVLIYGNKTVIGIQYVMMIPMLVAAFQFNKKHLTFSFAMVIPVLLLLYYLFPLIWTSMTIFERFTLLFILTGEYLVLLQLLHRSNELLERWIKTSRSERDLLVRNTVMEQLSKTDALTNVYNHRTFYEYLDNMIEQCESNHMTLQLAIVDIDNFKSINDTFGHAVGDVILKRVVETIKQTISSDEVIARYGGEEFAILFPTKTVAEAYQLCEEARKAVEELIHPELNERKVTVSIGLAEYACGMGKSRFFMEADTLLYQAKNTGKNKTMYYI